MTINIILQWVFWVLPLPAPQLCFSKVGKHIQEPSSLDAFFFFFPNGAQMLVRIKVTPNTFYIAIFQTE